MVSKIKSDEPIPKLEGFTVGDFWSWAYSDTLSNGNRAIFAEFLVGAALGVLDKPRIEWEGYDLSYETKKIEVKASAYLQSWPQVSLSKVSFDIACKNAWDSVTNTSANVVRRSADCYVFCLYAETDRTQANVFNIDAWEFYLVSTPQIDSFCGNQKSLALSRLRQLCSSVKFAQIKPIIDSVLFGK